VDFEASIGNKLLSAASNTACVLPFAAALSFPSDPSSPTAPLILTDMAMVRRVSWGLEGWEEGLPVG
jgi:hypothetical protein